MFPWFLNTVYFGLPIAHWMVLLSVGVSLTGAIAYLRDIFRGNSKPNLVTWGLWAFAPLIATGAALSAHADGWATARIFMSGFGPLLIFIAGVRSPYGQWKLHAFDYVCGALSVVALVAWLGAHEPIVAILLAAIADLVATMPTILKMWKYPTTETTYTYVAGIFTAALAIPAIPVWNIENAAFQVYILVANTSLALIALRGRAKKQV